MKSVKKKTKQTNTVINECEEIPIHSHNEENDALGRLYISIDICATKHYYTHLPNIKWMLFALKSILSFNKNSNKNKKQEEKKNNGNYINTKFTRILFFKPICYHYISANHITKASSNSSSKWKKKKKKNRKKKTRIMIKIKQKKNEKREIYVIKWIIKQG